MESKSGEKESVLPELESIQKKCLISDTLCLLVHNPLILHKLRYFTSLLAFGVAYFLYRKCILRMAKNT